MLGDAGPCDGLLEPVEDVEPNPGIDDHRFKRFCALVADDSEVGEVGEAVEVGEDAPLALPAPTDVSMVLSLWLREVLYEEPVVLGEL